MAQPDPKDSAQTPERKKRRGYILLLNSHPIAYYTNLKGLIEVVKEAYPHFPSSYYAISRKNTYPRVFNCKHGEFKLYRMQQNELVPFVITKEHLIQKGLIEDTDVKD